MSDREFDLIQDFLPDWIKAHQFAWVSVTMLPRSRCPMDIFFTSLLIRLLKACIFCPRSRLPMWRTEA